jgi:choline dehydrogenase-like flavoprotein
VTTLEADLAIVGSGVAGLLAARAPLAAGQRVVVVERGGLKTHAEQLKDGSYSVDVPGAEPNVDTAPGSDPYPWDFVFGVGGSTLHWPGSTPRFQENDFRMRSAYGVMRDWPIGMDVLEPFYRRAERVLGVAGAPRGAGGSTLPPHPFSPLDQAVAPFLEPYVPLPQARPTRAIGRRPACCGSARCELCPVDSRFSVLNGLRDVLDHPGLELRTETVAARLRLSTSGRRAESVECLDSRKRAVQVRAPLVVLAGGGFENPGLLMRSGLERADTGRFLYDHQHWTMLFRVRRGVRMGEGSSLSTGMSLVFADGSFRSRRSAALVSAYNPGISMSESIVDELVSGNDGRRLRRAALDTWRRTLPLDVLVEDIPLARRRVALSGARDAFGLPRLSVAYGPPTDYESRAVGAVRDALERRLAPLGVSEVVVRPGPVGGHSLGTCRMGDDGDAVVDSDLRHLDVENLYVVGGSAFPTYSPSHPTLTLSALALRLGDRLAGTAP